MAAERLGDDWACYCDRRASHFAALIGVLLSVACSPATRETAEPATLRENAALAPNVGPEFDLGRHFLANPGDDRAPAIASDSAGTSLVVWRDTLAAPAFGTYIFATRVAPDGTVIDANPIFISEGSTDPAVAHDGASWLVVWNLGSGVRAVRVGAAGTVLDQNDLVLSTTSSTFVGAPAVAFDGSTFLATWTDTRNGGNDVYGARIARDGTLLDPSGIPISVGVGSQRLPAMSRHTTGFFVAWEDTRNGNSDIYAARVGGDGTVLDASAVAISLAPSEQIFPAVSFDGATQLVTWGDLRNGNEVYGARVSGGTVLDPAGIPVATGAVIRGNPSLTHDGTNWLATFKAGSAIAARRVAASGEVLDANDIVVSSAAGSGGLPAMAHTGSSSLVVWQDVASSSTDHDIFGKRVDSSGRVIDANAIRISTLANEQFNPQISYNGTDWLVVWSGQQGGDSVDLYAARVGATGTVRDPNGIPLVTAPGAQARPAVSWGGSSYLVVWERVWLPTPQSDYSYDLRAMKVDANGTALDPVEGILLAHDTWTLFPQVAHDGTNWLVVWSPFEGTAGEGDIFGLRIGPALNVLDASPIPIATTGLRETSPNVSFGGTNWLVVWSAGGARGARIAPDGTVLDPAGFPIPSAADPGGSPSVSYDGTNWLAAWAGSRGGVRGYWAARVDASGAVLDPNGILMSTGPDTLGSLDVTHVGTSFFTVFGLGDVSGARLTSAGTALDPSGIPISAALRRIEANPAVAAGPDGSALVVYPVGDPYHSHLKARIVSQLGTGGGGGSGGSGASGAGGAGAGSGGVGAGGVSGSAGLSGSGGIAGSLGGVGGAAGSAGASMTGGLAGQSGAGGDGGDDGDGGTGTAGDGGAPGGSDSGGSAGSGVTGGAGVTGGSAGLGEGGNSTEVGGEAGARDYGEPVPNGGCGCRITNSAPVGNGPWALALLVFGLSARRSRRATRAR